MKTFELSKEQEDKVKDWIQTLPETIQTTFGGRFSYEFTPTGIGTVIIIRDNQTNETVDISDDF